jgi:5-methylcytosine-specific restriction protein B
MPPDSGKIEKYGKEITVQGLSLKTLLDTINERVNYLLDEDHQIGHAYFCSIEQDNAEQLRMVFKNKIIPLLREYFYNDHGKIRMVLGDRFVSKSPAKPKFAVRDEEDLMIEKSSYTIADIDNNFDIVAALTETLHGKG